MLECKMKIKQYSNHIDMHCTQSAHPLLKTDGIFWVKPGLKMKRPMCSKTCVPLHSKYIYN